MGMPPLLGEAWFAKNGSDLVQSFVYWAADFVVAPRADSSGEVVALYEGPVGEAEEKRFAAGGEFALWEEVSPRWIQQRSGACCLRGGRQSLVAVQRTDGRAAQGYRGSTHNSRGYMRVTLSPCLSPLPSSFRAGLRPRESTVGLRECL